MYYFAQWCIHESNLKNRLLDGVKSRKKARNYRLNPTSANHQKWSFIYPQSPFSPQGALNSQNPYGIRKKEDGKRIVASLEINDMFLLGLDDQLDINKANAQLLTKHLYRVQKVSSSYYTFRHHLASTLNNKEEEIYIQSFSAWQKYNPIKVTIDSLGHIERIK